jgi:hypothetical protein
MATRFIAIAVGFAAALAVAGCGGGTSSAETQTQPTKAEFVRKAQRICAAAGRKLETAGATYFTDPGATEKKFIETKVKPILEKDLIAKIDALPTPSGDEAKINAVLDALRQGLTTLRANPESIKAASGSAKDPLGKAGQLAKAYGLRCGG